MTVLVNTRAIYGASGIVNPQIKCLNKFICSFKICERYQKKYHINEFTFLLLTYTRQLISLLLVLTVFIFAGQLTI